MGKKQLDNKTTIVFRLWHFIALIVSIASVVIGSFFGYYKIVIKTTLINTEKHYNLLYTEQKSDIHELNKKIDNLSNAVNNVSNNLNLLNQKINMQTIHQPGTISLREDTTSTATSYHGNIVEVLDNH